MKKLLLLVVSLVMTVLLLYSQDYLLLYKQNQQNPKAIPINEIKSISHGDSNIQTIVTNSGEIETPISEIDSLVFSSIHLCPDDKHPHIINLGLPSGTLWSCCNVGASSPEAYGGYYSWGETEEKDVYNEVTYKYSTGVDTDGDGWYDDYHSDDDVYGIWQDLGDNIANTQYDVAHQKWGEDWRLPMYYDFEELVNHCTFQWTIVNGVNGGLFTSKTNGKSIFMPAAGYNWAGINDVTNNGYYWSSTPYPGKGFATYDLFFYSDSVTYLGWNNRSDGNSIRPVYDPWFFTPFSLSEDTVDVFVNSISSVVFETGRGMYELQNEHTDIMEAELILADKEKYPDGKDEILIYGISEGTAKLTVLNKRNNQSSTLVVNVKMPTDEDVTITKQYSESVRDYVNLQEEMPIEDFQNMVISWLDSQSYVKKTELSPNRDLITITFNNGAIFRIDFQDMSFFNENEDTPSYAPTMASDNNTSYDVSYQTGEKILDNANILLIQGREMPGDNSDWEYEDLKNINSPINVKWTLQKHTLRVFEKGLSSYGMICISQTHGFSNRVGGFQVQDNTWSKSYLNPAITQYVKDGLIYKRTDEPLIFDIYPNLFKRLKINNNAIIHGAYCWSYGLDYKLPEQAFFGYLTESSYAKNREYLYSFAYDLLNGKTFVDAVSELKNYPWFDFGGLEWQYTIVKKDNSKQRYFSISTEWENSEIGNLKIKGKINGYSNLKSGINYYVYVFDKNKKFNSSDIITHKPITINPDGTFNFEFSDFQITQYPQKYKFVVGFNYEGITYYGPILEMPLARITNAEMTGVAYKRDEEKPNYFLYDVSAVLDDLTDVVEWGIFYDNEGSKVEFAFENVAREQTIPMYFNFENNKNGDGYFIDLNSYIMQYDDKVGVYIKKLNNGTGEIYTLYGGMYDHSFRYDTPPSLNYLDICITGTEVIGSDKDGNTQYKTTATAHYELKGVVWIDHIDSGISGGDWYIIDNTPWYPDSEDEGVFSTTWYSDYWSTSRQLEHSNWRNLYLRNSEVIRSNYINWSGANGLITNVWLSSAPAYIPRNRKDIQEQSLQEVNQSHPNIMRATESKDRVQAKTTHMKFGKKAHYKGAILGCFE